MARRKADRESHGPTGRFWALSHPDRLEVLRMAQSPRTLDELAEALGSTRQAVSRHVDLLLSAGLLKERASRRERRVREFTMDPAKLLMLSNDLLRLVPPRPRPADLLALPTAEVASWRSADRPTPTPTPRQSPSLALLRGAEVAERFPLRGPPGTRWVLGRSARCDIALVDDERVSQRHAVLHADPRGFMLLDLESRNGTLLNGDRLAPGVGRAAGVGDIVRLGDSVLVFQ